MADLKMPEINYVIVAGNLTKDPIFTEKQLMGHLSLIFQLLRIENSRTAQISGKKMFVMLVLLLGINLLKVAGTDSKKDRQF